MARPNYLGSERADDLARLCTELLSEMWVMKDRIMVLEYLLEQKQVVQRSEIDRLNPPPDLESLLAQARERMVTRVLGSLTPPEY